MDETRWQDVERERLSLADLLDSLTSAQWETQSLRERWRVRDVAAHVAMSPVPEPSMSTLVAALVRAHGHLWEDAAAIAVDYAQRPTEEIAAGLRRVAASRAVPRVTNPDNLLMDLLVHGQDITIPLGIERPMPTDAAVAGFRRVWSMGWPFHARRRMRGMHLIATDAPVDVGDPDGARVQGRLGDLLLLITGRADPALDRLDGEGTARLRSIPRPSGGTR